MKTFLHSMPNTFTFMPLPQSPAATPRTRLPARVPSCQEKPTPPGYDFLKETTMQGIRKCPRHILTFDLEEHFPHASRFDSPMRRRNWSSYESSLAH